MTAGDVFGRWTVIGSPFRDRRRSYVQCRCACGTEKAIRLDQLRSGESKSCGCLQRESAVEVGKGRRKHGMYGTPTYSSWAEMIKRCRNPNSSKFHAYGAVGVSVCERWLKFENFYEDMGDRPEGTSIDRFPDGKGNYEPGNCRWATASEQAQNLSCNKLDWAQVEQIRADTRSTPKIAKDYAVSTTLIGLVKGNKVWKV